jgi:CheY-like chemotaxis protein
MAVILVVDDEEQIRVLAESVLRDCGHQTLSAATDDMEAGLVHPGLELAQQALRLRPALRVLYTTEEAVTDGMKALFVKDSEFLAKPYDVNQLSGKVAKMLPRSA